LNHFTVPFAMCYSHCCVLSVQAGASPGLPHRGPAIVLTSAARGDSGGAQ
jgi:hypothetical protein